MQALFSPPGLQQMQQFLQHVVNNNNNNNKYVVIFTEFFFCCLFYFIFFREIEIHFMFYSNNGGLAPGFNPTHLQHFMQQSNLLNQHQVSAYYYNYFYLRMSKFLILKFIPIILF